MDREQAVDALYGERFIIDGEEEKMKEIRKVAEAVGEADSAEASIVYFSQDNRQRLLQELRQYLTRVTALGGMPLLRRSNAN
jgi:hypothetical protein